MRKKAAGYAINLLMLAYLGLGVWVVIRTSIFWGVLYIVLIGLSFVVVAYAWCAKCPCRSGACTHIWVGKLTKFLPRRKPGKYTAGDWAGQVIYLLGLHLLPQYWLWQDKVLFALFWVLALATFLAGPLYACKGCPNKRCYVDQLQSAG
jgi:hypothetical protein